MITIASGKASQVCQWLAACCGLLCVGLLCGGPVLLADEASAEVTASRESHFEQHIRPVLAGVCFRCHGGERVSGGLRVDSREGLLSGGDSGPAIDPGRPRSSLLWQAIARVPDVSAMPPSADGALSAAQVRAFQDWIETGAFWPEKAGAFEVQQHWAFRPLASVSVPDIQSHSWVQTPVDAFVLSAMREAGVSPVNPADRRTLIRRVTFDLTGLPPTPAEVAAFLEDGSAEAFARVIDRLLASPAYGEKWGRHWLDVVRYADTAGETADYPVPSAWRYRNYVIDAFNADLPYDQFVREQVAGDLLGAEQPEERFSDRTIATGFLAISRRFGFDSENYQHLTIQDTIDTLGQTVLGLSIGCARCHDHKFDPISMRDYYAFYGIFDSSRYPFPGSEQKPRVRALAPLLPAAEAAVVWDASLQRIRQLTAQLTDLQQPLPTATLRLTTDIDGDFELQAPAAGGSYGVLVPPWRSSGEVSVSAAAQSPFHNVYPGGSRGALAAQSHAPWRIRQALHLEDHGITATGGAELVKPVCLNADLRIGSVGDREAAPLRLQLTSADLRQSLTLVFHAGRIQQAGTSPAVDLGHFKPGEWFNLQLSLRPDSGELRVLCGTPEVTAASSSSTVPWEAVPALLELSGDGSDTLASPALEVDQIAVRRTPFASVSREFPLIRSAPAEGTSAAMAEELEQLTGIDGDLELQPPGGVPTAPWNPGPGSVVRVRAESQSPFTVDYSPGEQGFYLPGRREYDGFGLTIRRLPTAADGRLRAGFDFRLQPESADAAGSWRYYLGHGPGSSAAVELFLTAEQLYCRMGDQLRPVAAVGSGHWQQLRLVLDTRLRTFTGSLESDGVRQLFAGDFSTGWDGSIDYSFIDSYGHIPGLRPALDADNFVLTGFGPGSSKSPAEVFKSVAQRRERIEQLRKLQRDQQSEAVALQTELQQLLQDGPLPLAFAMSEGTPEDARLQLRGEPMQPGDTVPRGFLTVLGDAVPPVPLRGSGRRELAGWLVRPSNPLTARVLVNRVWQQHFGRGLVGTPNDFGVRGLAPTHPQLLDWLASDFMRQGWSIKSLHRLILTSAVWQQAAAERVQGNEQDRLRGFSRRRLSAEEIRDSILAVTGQLDRSPGIGHPFPAATVWGFSQHAPFSDVYEHSRRSVYLMTPRLKRHPFLALFDGADPNASTAVRLGTTVPTQSLFFLNDPLVHQSAERWAESLLASSADEAECLKLAWQQALQRDPDAGELQESREFLEEYRRELPGGSEAAAARTQALAALLRAVLGSNEFLHVE
ncbi:MAG: PSD1 and planctomycete cytochrome C domain-containing protein [Planctomycetota bacterium]